MAERSADTALDEPQTPAKPLTTVKHPEHKPATHDDEASKAVWRYRFPPHSRVAAPHRKVAERSADTALDEPQTPAKPLTTMKHPQHKPATHDDEASKAVWRYRFPPHSRVASPRCAVL